jgi:hypothetical protein
MIAGGTLEIDGGTAVAGIVFSGTDGFLSDYALPSAVISGFTAGSGDEIELSGIGFVSSATVAVKKAGVVTISAGGKTYNLNIAGATVGETDFAFSGNDILTRGTQAASAMTFMRPDASPTAGAALVPMHRETLGAPSFVAEPKLVAAAPREDIKPAMFVQDLVGRQNHAVKLPVSSHGV